ncbi:hypothetical protein [Streptococcus equi]|uniref:hypothetical protein n=1 Tax=Streptococcus equi TaxID=1336 RepID=UPI001E4252A9|nr:hypothetical protein [Streptococcus equi]
MQLTPTIHRSWVEAIKRITPNISDQAAKAELDLLSYNALIAAKTATDKEVLQSNEVRIIANYILTGNPIETASFSFDDKTLRLHENYQDTDLTVRYSIDNGKTWLETKDKVIVFSDDLLAKLNVEDGILVGFDAVSASKPTKIPSSTLSLAKRSSLKTITLSLVSSHVFPLSIE